MDCDALLELGPPPILSLPPPPIPPNMEEFVSRLTMEGISLGGITGAPGSEDTKEPGSASERLECNLCHWASGNQVGFVELARKGPLIDDTWFLVIISSCVAATLVGVILAIAFLKYREGKLKPLSDVALAKKEKALGLERCEAVLYPGSPLSSTPGHLDPRASRALWAAIKPLEGNHYTIDNCQPIEQKSNRLDLLSPSLTYDYADFNAQHYKHMDYATLASQCSEPLSQKPVPATSFENIGYDAGDEGARDKKDSNVNGCAVSSRGSAVRLLGSPHHNGNSPTMHHYEMVTPALRRQHPSLDRGNRHEAHVVPGLLTMGPKHHSSMNVHHEPQYKLTALANGSHSLTPKVNGSPWGRLNHPHGHMVLLDPSGGTTNTLTPPNKSNGTINNLSPASPTDHIYVSPITSPVI